MLLFPNQPRDPAFSAITVSFSMTKIIPVIRFFVALPFFVLAIVGFGTLMILFSPFTYKYHFWLFHAWADVTIWAGGLKTHAEGLENIDPNQQYIFVCNHQSLLDVPLLTKLFPMRPRFVAKSSLDKIPYFAAILHQLGTICIDRNDRKSAIERLLSAKNDRHHETTGIVFFPEGTRTSDGEIGSFKKGAVMTALSLKLPIIPMAIAGNFEALPKGTISLRPGHVRLAVGKPIAVGENTAEEKDRLLEVVPAAVKALYEGIRSDLDCSGNTKSEQKAENDASQRGRDACNDDMETIARDIAG